MTWITIGGTVRGRTGQAAAAACVILALTMSHSDGSAHITSAHIASARIAPALRIALALAACALLLTLVLVTALPPRNHFIALLNNAGHAPIFGAVAWLTLQWLPQRERGPLAATLRLFIAFAVAIALGAAVEGLQFLMGRGASHEDVLMDAAGAAFVLCLLALRQQRNATAGAPAAGRRLLHAGALCAAAVVIAPLAGAAHAYFERQRVFPELVRFDGARALYFLEGGGASLSIAGLPGPWAAGRPQAALRVRIGREHTPGLRVNEPVPDWRGYRMLVLELVNPGRAPLQLTVRVHDAAHDQRHEDRFNRVYVLEAGSRREIHIALEDIARAPIGRRLDLARVTGLGLFESSGRAPVGAELYVLRIGLE